MWLNKLAAALGIAVGWTTAFTAGAAAATRAPVKIAVFEFELENTSPTGKVWAETSDDSETMKMLTAHARKALEASGRYTIVETKGVDAAEVKDRSLRNCHGCDADIAKSLGADQSIIGVISRAGQTEYYVSLRITDAVKHEVVYRHMSFYIGGENGWASGVRDAMADALSAAAGTSKP